MTAWQLLISAWDWEPAVLIGCAGLLGAYVVATRLRPAGAAFSFAGGVLVLLVALISPLHTLGDTYLFSAHMVQHLLLVLIVPPLLLRGLPDRPIRQLLDRWPVLARIERTLRRPVIGWVLGMGVLWLWHAPALYNAALRDPDLHRFEHLCFLVTATIFWWPVAGPVTTSRLAPLAAVLYLFLACVANLILGILLTFAPAGLYPAYLFPYDSLGILPLLREGWGLTPVVDQQVGGLVMWIPGSLVFLVAIVGTLMAWLHGASPAEDVPPAAGYPSR